MRTTDIKCPYLSKTYLKNYYERDKRHPYNVKYDAIEDFKGLTDHRKSTDKKYLVVYLLLMVCLAIFLGLSLRRYNYQRLFRPQDFRGDYCGMGFLADKPYVYWPNPEVWGYFVKTCVTECPNADNKEVCFYDEWNKSYYEDYCFLTMMTYVS